MTALILDTSQNVSILGLADGKNLTKSHPLEGRSHALLPILKDFCDFKSLLYIAVGTGPGSYMGIRTSATVAKTLSFALKIPLVSYPSPLAFLPSEKGSFTIVGDAKMGELYVMTGIIKDTFSLPILITPEELQLDTDFVVDLRKNPPPNLDWVCQYAHTQFIQGNILETNALKLDYLR